MLSHRDKQLVQRLVQEERLRIGISSELSKETAKAPPLLSDNVKWIIVTLLIPLVTAIYGYYQTRIASIKAESDQQIAIANQAQEALLADARNDVTAMTALLPALSDPDEHRSKLALFVLGRLESAQRGAADPKIQAIYGAIKGEINKQRDSKDRKVANIGARKLETLLNASGNTQQLGAAAGRPVAPDTKVREVRPERVYVQVFTDAQFTEALRAQEGLRNLGVAVPGIENVGAKLPRGTLPGWQVRYFADADLGAALWTKARLAALGFDQFQVYRSYTSANVPAGQVEIWWPNSRKR